MAEERKSLMRCLGEFAGHIVRGIKTPVDPSRQEIGRQVEEKTEDGITLRRTVVDEIEIPSHNKTEDA